MAIPHIALCFDLDGVLIDSMPLHARAWQEALRAVCGLRVRRQWIYEREGEPGLATARTLLKQRGVPSWARMSLLILKEKERRFRWLARHVKAEARLIERLRRFSRQRVPLALVTGTSAREVARVVPRTVLALFDVVVTGDRVRHGKPHPEPYRRAFQALGVKPARAVVIENAPYGIRAARRAHAGLVIALASSLPKRCLGEAHVVVSAVPKLCALLDRVVAWAGVSRRSLR
jgi:beta-phosphoglucomutase